MTLISIISWNILITLNSKRTHLHLIQLLQCLKHFGKVRERSHADRDSHILAHSCCKAGRNTTRKPHRKEEQMLTFMFFWIIFHDFYDCFFIITQVDTTWLPIFVGIYLLMHTWHRYWGLKEYPCICDAPISSLKEKPISSAAAYPCWK